ncbi:hypothetical protein SABIM44S_04269 [Streptomyces abikoensis]
MKRLATLVAAIGLAFPLAGTGVAHAEPPPPTGAKVQWIDRTTVAWPKGLGDPARPHRLLHDRGSFTLTAAPGGLTPAQRAKYPHLAGYEAYRVDATPAQEKSALRGAVTATAGDVTTGVQIPGVLDDLYASAAAKATLGPSFRNGRPTLAVWAPTARNVSLELDGRTVPMHRDDAGGVWRATGGRDWNGKSYRYAVTVHAPAAGKVVTNRVTDPYATALTADSARSVVADLADPALAPPGWRTLRKPKAVPLRDAQIQELHIRDFSTDGYRAFTDRSSPGMKHLKSLATAGTSYVHLLPAFDFATAPERRADQATPPCDLAALPADSPRQQECVRGTAARDAYNWGYDPLHYTVPEGSYASDPDGPGRTREFRQMVQGLAGPACARSWTSSTTTPPPPGRTTSPSWTGSCPVTTSASWTTVPSPRRRAARAPRPSTP